MRVVNNRKELEQAIKDSETEFITKDKLFEKQLKFVAKHQHDSEAEVRTAAGALSETATIIAILVTGVLVVIGLLLKYDVELVYDPVTKTFKLVFKK